MTHIIGADGNPTQEDKKDVLFLEDEVAQPWWLNGPLEGCHLTYSNKGDGRLSTNVMFYAPHKGNLIIYSLELGKFGKKILGVGPRNMAELFLLPYEMGFNRGLKGTIEDNRENLLTYCKEEPESDAIQLPYPITEEEFPEKLENIAQFYFTIGKCQGDFDEDAEEPEERSRIVAPSGADLAHVNATKRRD